jgi:hypothetical protein
VITRIAMVAAVFVGLAVVSRGEAVDSSTWGRKSLPVEVPVEELDRLLEEKLIFLVDATGIPVLLSLLVLMQQLSCASARLKLSRSSAI